MIRVYNSDITKAAVKAANKANKAVEDARRARLEQYPDTTYCPALEAEQLRAMGWPDWLISVNDNGTHIDTEKIERLFRDIFTVDVDELTDEERAAIKEQERDFRLAFNVCGQLPDDMPGYFVFTWKNGKVLPTFNEGEFYAMRARQVITQRIDNGELPKPFPGYGTDSL